eukprot:5778676-Pyramimonas_sp.AAC.2
MWGGRSRSWRRLQRNPATSRCGSIPPTPLHPVGSPSPSLIGRSEGAWAMQYVRGFERQYR